MAQALEEYTDIQIMDEFQKRFFDGIITREWAKAFGFRYFSTYGSMQMYIKEDNSTPDNPEFKDKNQLMYERLKRTLYLCFWVNPDNDTVQTIKFNDVDITKISEFKELFKEKYQREFLP